MSESQDNYIQKLEQKVKDLKELVVLDPLTKILNRRGIDTQLDIFDSMYKRYEIDYFVSFVDINNFKQINDKHGHLYGDTVLQRCAKSIQKNIRVSDTVGRIGGDEFMVLFYSPKNDDFSIICQKLFQTVENECGIKLTFVTAQRSNFPDSISLLGEIDTRFIIKKKYDI